MGLFKTNQRIDVGCRFCEIWWSFFDKLKSCQNCGFISNAASRWSNFKSISRVPPVSLHSFVLVTPFEVRISVDILLFLHIFLIGRLQKRWVEVAGLVRALARILFLVRHLLLPPETEKYFSMNKKILRQRHLSNPTQDFWVVYSGISASGDPRNLTREWNQGDFTSERLLITTIKVTVTSVVLFAWILSLKLPLISGPTMARSILRLQHSSLLTCRRTVSIWDFIVPVRVHPLGHLVRFRGLRRKIASPRHRTKFCIIPV